MSQNLDSQVELSRYKELDTETAAVTGTPFSLTVPEGTINVYVQAQGGALRWRVAPDPTDTDGLIIAEGSELVLVHPDDWNNGTFVADGSDTPTLYARFVGS